MKKVVTLIFCILSYISYVNAQNYNEYLSLARRYLTNGDIEKAQNAYSIYCTLSNSRSISFEKQLAEMSATIGIIIAGSDFIENTVDLNIRMIYVEGGKFLMGGTDEQIGDARQTEFPTREITLKSFYIGECEITQGQWEKVMGVTAQEKGCREGDGLGINYPMYGLSWDDANSFCEKLSELTGKKYTLPTEAQWEYAARGGQKADGTIYCGSDKINEVAWVYRNSDGMTQPVKSKKPNSIGLYDMSGNVEEWCLDWYNEYDTNDTNNPIGPLTGQKKVLRGGGCFSDPAGCRVSRRNGYNPQTRWADGGRFGLRVVVNL